MYFSTLPAPSSSAPCILAILTHLQGCIQNVHFDIPPLAARRSPACLHPPSSLLETYATLQETATAFGGVFTAKTESDNHIAT